MGKRPDHTDPVAFVSAEIQVLVMAINYRDAQAVPSRLGGQHARESRPLHLTDGRRGRPGDFRADSASHVGPR